MGHGSRFSHARENDQAQRQHETVVHTLIYPHLTSTHYTTTGIMVVFHATRATLCILLNLHKNNPATRSVGFARPREGRIGGDKPH